MSNTAGGKSDGLAFFLVGANVPPGTFHLSKFSMALTRARNDLRKAIGRVIQLMDIHQLLPRDRMIFDICFRPGPNEVADACKKANEVFQKTFAGLSSSGLTLCEADPIKCAEVKGEGYVPNMKLGIEFLRGDIHVKFDYPEAHLPRLLIHEATHKFAGTDDLGYIAQWIDQEMALAQANIVGQGLIKNSAQGLANADSYAAFAVTIH